MKCSYCEHEIPADSLFCPKCGRPIENMTAKPATVERSTPVNSLNAKNMTDFEVLSETDLGEVTGSTPILVNKVVILKRRGFAECAGTCIMTNLGVSAISAVLLDLICFDVWGAEIDRITSVQYLDLSVKYGDSFGEDVIIPIPNENTRAINVELKRIRYCDGSIVDCSGEKCALPKPHELEEYLESKELAQQYQRDTSVESSLVPVQFGPLWLCSCGALNNNSTQVCEHCHVEKEKIFSLLDTNILAQNHALWIKENAQLERQRQLQQEKLRQEQQEHIRAQERIRQEQEALRLAKVQRDREIAMQKRREAEAAANKKKSIVKIVVGLIIVGLIVVWGIKEAKDSEYRGQLRNMATEEMDASFTNVYADVISVDPYYFVYQYKTTSSGTKIGSGDLWEIVCKCQTVEGKTIWASFFYQRYPGGNYSKREDDYKTLTYSKTNPLRITGSVDTARQVVKELENEIGNILVLDVRQVSNK